MRWSRRWSTCSAASVARHCTLTYHSPGPLPLVETDPTQIRQVVLNLIVNAAEAVDDHGVITVETGERNARSSRR